MLSGKPLASRCPPADCGCSGRSQRVREDGPAACHGRDHTLCGNSYDHSSISGFVPFLAPETKSAPTRVEVHFDARWPGCASGEDASLLRYTLELERNNPNNLAPTEVGYEALHAFPKGRPRRIFERRRGKAIYIAREMKVRPRDDRLPLSLRTHQRSRPSREWVWDLFQ